MTLEEIRLRGTGIRVHGNGFLQIDVGEGERIHVFGHPGIPRQKVSTPIHNHRFGFTSTVLKGCLVNLTWAFCPDRTYRATHQGYVARVRHDEDTQLEPIGDGGALSLLRTEVILPGRRYSMLPRQFHQSLADEPTVTHMHKTEVADIEPTVLCRRGMSPDNNFDRYDLDEPALWRILEESML
jgi:hypothetical protein